VSTQFDVICKKNKPSLTKSEMSLRDRLSRQLAKSQGDEHKTALQSLTATTERVDSGKVRAAIERLTPKVRELRSKIEKRPSATQDRRPDGNTALRVAEMYVDKSPLPDIQTVAIQTFEGLAAASDPDGNPRFTEAYRALVMGAIAVKNQNERARVPHPSYFEDRIETIKTHAQVKMKFTQAKVTFRGRLLGASGILLQGGLTIGANVVLNAPEMAQKFAGKQFVDGIHQLNPAILSYMKMYSAGLVFDVMTVGSSIIWTDGPSGPVPLRKRFIRALLKAGLKHATLLISFVVATPGVVGFGTAMLARVAVSLATGAITKVLDVTLFAPTPEEAVHQTEMAVMRAKFEQRDEFENLVAQLKAQPLEHQTAKSARMEVVYGIIVKANAAMRPHLQTAANHLYGIGTQAAVVAGLAGISTVVVSALFPAVGSVVVSALMATVEQLAAAPVLLIGSILTGVFNRMVPMMLYRGQMWVLNLLVSYGVVGFVKLLQITGVARAMDTAWSPLRKGLAAFAYSAAGQELSDMINDLSVIHILGTLLRTVGYSAATGCAQFTTVHELFNDKSVYGRALAKNALIDALSGRSSLGIVEAVGSVTEFGSVVEGAIAIRDATIRTTRTKWTQFEDKGCGAFTPTMVPDTVGEVPDGTLLFDANHQPTYKVFSGENGLKFTDLAGNAVSAPSTTQMRDLAMDFTLLETDQDVPVDRLTIGMEVRTSSKVADQFRAFTVTHDGLTSKNDPSFKISLDDSMLAGQHYLRVDPTRVTNSDTEVFVKFQPEHLMRRVMGELLEDPTMKEKLDKAGIDGSSLHARLTATEKDALLLFHDELTQFKKTSEIAANLLDLDVPVPEELKSGAVCSEEEIQARTRTITTKPPPAVAADSDIKIYLGGRVAGTYGGVEHAKYTGYLDGLLCMRLRMDYEAHIESQKFRPDLDTSDWVARQEAQIKQNNFELNNMYGHLDEFFAAVNKGNRQRQLKSATAHLSQSRWSNVDFTPIKEQMRQDERQTTQPNQTQTQAPPPQGQTRTQAKEGTVRGQRTKVTTASVRLNAMRVAQTTRHTRVAMIKSALDVLQDVSIQQQVGQTLGLTLATMVGFFDEMGALEAGRMLQHASFGELGPKQMLNPDLKGKSAQDLAGQCMLVAGDKGSAHWRLIEGDEDGARFADLPVDEQDRMIRDCGFHKGFMSVLVGVGLSAAETAVRAGLTVLGPMLFAFDPTGYLQTFVGQGTKHVVVWIGLFLTERGIDSHCQRLFRCPVGIKIDDCPPGAILEDETAQSEPNQMCALLMALSKSLVDAETFVIPMPGLSDYKWYRCGADTQATRNISAKMVSDKIKSYSYDYTYDAGEGTKAYKFFSISTTHKGDSGGLKTSINLGLMGAQECADVSLQMMANPVLKGKIYMNNIVKSTTGISTDFLSEGPTSFVWRTVKGYLGDKAFEKAGKKLEDAGFNALFDNEAVNKFNFYQTRAKQRARGMRMHYHTSTILESSITSLLSDRDEFKDRAYYTLDTTPDAPTQKIMERDVAAMLEKKPGQLSGLGKTPAKIVAAAVDDMDIFVDLRIKLQEFRRTEALRSVEESDSLMGGLGTFDMLGTLLKSGGASILIGDKDYSHPGSIYHDAPDLGIAPAVLRLGEDINAMTGGVGFDGLRAAAKGVDTTLWAMGEAQRKVNEADEALGLSKKMEMLQQGWDGFTERAAKAWPFSAESLWP